MNPETIINILADANRAVPQWVMVWDPKAHRFELYRAYPKDSK